MNIREALQLQSPSLALQRAAADEIARLDSQLAALMSVATQMKVQLSYVETINPVLYSGAVKFSNQA